MVLRLKTLSNEKMRFYALGPRHWLIVICASKFPTQTVWSLLPAILLCEVKLWIMSDQD